MSETYPKIWNSCPTELGLKAYELEIQEQSLFGCAGSPYGQHSFYDNTDRCCFCGLYNSIKLKQNRIIFKSLENFRDFSRLEILLLIFFNAYLKVKFGDKS